MGTSESSPLSPHYGVCVIVVIMFYIYNVQQVGRLFMGTPESSPLSPHYGVRVVVVEDDVHQGTGENDANNGDADDDAKDDDVKMLIARMVTPMAKTENNVSKSDVNLLE